MKEELIKKAKAEILLNLDSDLLDREDLILRLQSLIESIIEEAYEDV